MPVVQVGGGLINTKPVIRLRQGIMDAHDGRLAIMRVDPEGACMVEFIPLSFWYDAPLTSQYSDRRHDPWLVYGSPSCSPAQ